MVFSGTHTHIPSPTVLITEEINPHNEYTERLACAYVDAGYQIMLGVQNFYHSNFIPNVLHIQWPEALYKWRHRLELNDRGVEIIRKRLVWFRANGAKIIHTIHNLEPHKILNRTIEHDIYKIIIEHSDVLVHHGQRSIELLGDVYPEAKGRRNIVCPHGEYSYTKIERSTARSKYELPQNKFIILNFGRQRENKGENFIDAAFAASNITDKYLFTIGPRSTLGSGILTRVRERVKNKIRQLDFPDKKRIYRTFYHNEIPFILNACDLVLLGHQQGLNSGILALAATYEKPVVFPDIGNFSEQVIGWIGESYRAGDMDDACQAINRLHARLANNSLELNNKEWLANNHWGRHVGIISDALHLRRENDKALRRN